MKAEVALKKRAQSGDIAENFDREIKNFKLKVPFNHRRAMSRLSSLAYAGFRTYAITCLVVALREGSTDTRKGVILLRRYVAVIFCTSVWDGTSV
jgi:hypothetical protein